MKFSVYYKGELQESNYLLQDATYFINSQGGLIKAIPDTTKRSGTGFVWVLENLSADKDYRIEYIK